MTQQSAAYFSQSLVFAFYLLAFIFVLDCIIIFEYTLIFIAL
jgi:hypothetical protein